MCQQTPEQSSRISTTASSLRRSHSHSHAQQLHIPATMVKYVLTGSTGGLGSQVLKYLLRLVPGTSHSSRPFVLQRG